MKFNSRRVREIALVVLVALAATLANLPEETLERFDIDRGFLLGSLALVVFIALFLYLKFQFFFLVVLLAVAANMPGEVRSEERRVGKEWRWRGSPDDGR